MNRQAVLGLQKLYVDTVAKSEQCSTNSFFCKQVSSASFAICVPR